MDKVYFDANKIYEQIHTCSVEGCTAKGNYNINGKHYCYKHHYHIIKFGSIKRTIYDKNEIIINDDYAYIVLYNKKSEEIARAKIDVKNVDSVKDYKWYLRPDGYVATINYLGKYAYLHSVILQTDNKPFVDHKNRDKLDNTESNLREATGIENHRNKSLSKNNTSGKAGVSWSSQRQKWVAYIKYGDKNRNLGGFDKFEDAVACRIAAEKE